jgi:hypothetical protein
MKYLLIRWGAVVVLDFGLDRLENSNILRDFNDYPGIVFCISREAHPIEDDLLKYIHCSFEYGYLDSRTRLTLWRRFFATSPPLQYLGEKEQQSVSEKPLDGHQIAACTELLKRVDSPTLKMVLFQIDHVPMSQNAPVHMFS